MIKLRKIIFFILGLFIFYPHYSDSQNKNGPKDIFVIFSLGYGLPGYDAFMQSFRKTMKEKYKSPLNIYVQYLEADKFQDEEILKEKIELLKHKCMALKMDVVVAVGPEIEFILDKYAKDFFKGTPVIYLDNRISEYDTSNTVRKQGAAYLYIDAPVKKNIESGLQLFPETRHIYFVCGTSIADMRYISYYKKEFKEYENRFDINYLTGLSMNTTLEKVKNLPENSIIFMPTFQMDSSNSGYYTAEAIQLVYEKTNAPIICLYKTAIGTGAVGGYVFDMDKAGEKTSGYCERILNGENPDNFEIPVREFGELALDGKLIKKFKINERLLPEGSIILNREYSFYELNIFYIYSGIFFILLETLLLIYLSYFYRKQKRQSKTIHEHEERYKTLIDFNRLTELSELTASISHQLNQPLTAILSSTQAAQRFLKNEKYDKILFEEILSNIVDDVKRSSEIMNSLRGMIKKDTREKKRLNINNVANEVSLLFKGMALMSDIYLETDYEPIELFVNGDSILLEQVILNLLLNSTEALEKKASGLKKINLKTELIDGYVFVSVSDNGPGISDKLKDEIFKPFFTTKERGLGIGLAICRSIIEDHEGKIEFTNNKWGGATFSFKLKYFNERN